MRPFLAIALFLASSAGTLAAESLLKTYTTPEGRCTFSTVEGRKPVTANYQRGEGPAEAKGKVYCFDQRNCRCQVRFVDLPRSAKGLSTQDVVERYCFAAWIERGKLERVGEVKAGDLTGDAFLVTNLPGVSSENDLSESERLARQGLVRLRVFVVENRAYFVSAATTVKRQAVAEPEAEAFLDSFRVAAK